MKTYNVPEEILIGIRNYLISRPYAEVVEGVTALTNILREQSASAEAQETKEEPKK